MHILTYLDLERTILELQKILREERDEREMGERYIEEEYYINPQIILVLEQYSERSVSVLGQVARPEQIVFPLEAKKMNIVQAITLAGGLTRLAKVDSIQVTRTKPSGEEMRITVDVESYLANKKNSAEGVSFYLVPGDVVFVPERTF